MRWRWCRTPAGKICTLFLNFIDCDFVPIRGFRTEEVVQPGQSLDYRGQGGWHRHIRHIRDMRLAIHRHLVYFGVEGGFHRARGTRKCDEPPTARHVLYREPAVAQPCRNLGNIRRRHAEARPKRVRRQPLVKAARTLVLLRIQQRPQSSFLLVARLENQDHML